jgi:flagellar motor protein MotB
MRGLVRRPIAIEEEESAFVSMTDMTVSFLFIVMILLAFFATQYREQDSVPKHLYEELGQEYDAAQREIERLRILLQINQRNLELAVVERDQGRDEVERLGALLQTARSELSNTRIELRRAQERVMSLEAQVDDLKRTVAELEASIEKLLAKIEALKQPHPLEEYLTRAAEARLQILRKLKGDLEIDFPDLMMEISTESDALRFQGEGLFRTGEFTLREEPRRIVETIAIRLNELLPCYTLGPRSTIASNDCNGALAIIESVQIEGHTDSTGDDLANLTLSTARANSTFVAMFERVRDIVGHLNYREQPVLSVAGYGQMRPAASNATDHGRSTNRRIDLRIIMFAPRGADDVEKIRRALRPDSLAGSG